MKAEVEREGNRGNKHHIGGAGCCGSGGVEAEEGEEKEEEEEEETWEGAASGFLTEPRAKQPPKKGKTTPHTRANKAGRTVTSVALFRPSGQRWKAGREPV